MANQKPHVCVCICTYKRPQLLKRLLEAISRQRTDGIFDYSVVVVDNDQEESARGTVAEFAGASPLEVRYFMVPTPNFALARNEVVKHATGEYLAFIDDDEFPADGWLATLFKTCNTYQVAGVLGPVLPHFETPPPHWLVIGRFYDRPRHPTGFVLTWPESRTGNVLFRREIIEGVEEVFNPEFQQGGEDQDFFRRMMEKGHKFIWCDEAPAYETVPPHRWKRRFLIERALLRGRTTFRHPANRWKNLAKSLVAVPLYILMLPFLLIAGHHLFMKYFVRLFDHLGRLLSPLGLNPVSKRSH